MPPVSRSAAGKTAGGAGAVSLIIAALFAVEGGYSNNKTDPGGATNHGVTERVARTNGYTGDMRALTKARASEIATEQYIVKPGYMPIVERSPTVAEEMVDAAYNVGPARESLWLQQSLNHLNNQGHDYADVAEDGQVGAGTIAAYDALIKKRGVEGCRTLIKMLDAKQAQHYMKLFGKNSAFESFAFGWFRTRIENVDLTRC